MRGSRWKFLFGCGISTACAVATLSARADCGGGPGDPAPGDDPFAPVHRLLGDVVKPLSFEYLDLSRFELDPLSADLADLENQEKPKPKRPKTLTYRVRFDSHRFDPKASISTSSGVGDLGPTLGFSEDGETLHLENAAKTALGLKDAAIDVPVEELRGMSVEEIRKKFGDFAATADWNTGKMVADPNRGKMMASYLRLVSQNTESGWNSAVADIGKRLSVSEQIRLVQISGREMANRYGTERSAATAKNFFADPGSKPFEVTSNLTTLREKYICRDDANAQQSMLNGFGSGWKAYQIRYNAGGNHQTVIAQNPENKKELLLFNYDDVDAREMDGTRSLTYREDYSTSYTIIGPNKKTVAVLPSELGLLAADGAGANIRRVDPMAFHPQGSVASLSLDGEKSKMPIFVGQTSSGDRIVGIGRTTGVGNDSKSGVTVSNTMALFYQQKNVPIYSDEKTEMDAVHFMDLLNVDYRTKWATVKTGNGGVLQGRATTGVSVQADVAVSDVSKKFSVDHVGGNLTPISETGVDARYRSPNGATTVNLRAATQLGLGTVDATKTGDFRVYRNVSYVDLNGETAIVPEKLSATFRTALAVREFGPQIFTQVGVKNEQKRWEASLAYSGALKKDALLIAPGSGREISGEFEKNVGRNFRINVTYQQPTDVAIGRGFVQAGVKGTIGGKKKARKPVRY